MSSRRLYDADGEVIVACTARGDVTVTARKLERWRQAGCLLTRPSEHRDGLRGSVSANPDGYVDQVLAISAALRGGLALRRVPIALFADDFPIDLDVLRSAYLDLLGELRRMAAAVAGADHSDPLDVADAVAVAFAGRLSSSMLAPMVKRAQQMVATQPGRRTRGEARNMLEGALSAAFGGLFAGETPTLEGTRELLALAGLADGQDLATSAQHLATTNVETIKQAVRTAEDQWFEARRMAEAIRRYMRRRKRLEHMVLPPGQRLPGLDLELPDDAFSRGMLIPQQLVMTDYERDIAMRRTAAMDALVEHIEAGPPTLDIDDESEPSEQQRNEARSRGTEWAAAHPAEMQLVLGIDTPGPDAKASSQRR